MSAQHRKPFMAFVLLAFVAFGLVGLQHADAQGSRLLAAPLGAAVHVTGTLEVDDEDARAQAADRVAALGPAFSATVSGDARTVTVVRSTAASAGAEGSTVAGAGILGGGQAGTFGTTTTTSTGTSTRTSTGTSPRTTTRARVTDLPVRPTAEATPDRRTDKARRTARKGARDRHDQVKQARRTQRELARAAGDLRRSLNHVRSEVERFLAGNRSSWRSDRPGKSHGHRAHRSNRGKAYGHQRSWRGRRR